MSEAVTVPPGESIFNTTALIFLSFSASLSCDTISCTILGRERSNLMALSVAVKNGELFGPSLETVVLVIIVISVPTYARIVRTQALSLKNTEFILAERALGAGLVRILSVHMLPNVIGPLLIIASMDVPFVVTIEAGLSFLGLGVRPPTPSWGGIINDGYSYIRNTAWLVIAGGLPLIVTTLGFTFLGEALRDIFDPKLRKDL